MEDDELDNILGGDAFSDDLSDLNDSLSRHACDDTAPCGGVGLDSDEQRAASEAAARQLQADWAHLNQAQRRRRVREYVRDLGERAGLPQPVGVDFHSGSSGRAAVGIFRSHDWEMDIYEDISGNDAPTPFEFQNYFRTLNHETRHAEQSWLIARRMAGADHSEDEIRYRSRNPAGGEGLRRRTLPRSVARAARAQPLPDPNAPEAANESERERDARRQACGLALWRSATRDFNEEHTRTHENHERLDAAWTALQDAENAEERNEDAVREATRNWEHALDRYRCVMNEGDAYEYEINLDFVDD